MTQDIHGLSVVSVTAKVLYNSIVWGLAAFFAYLKLPIEMMGIYFTLLIIDLCTGWMAAFVVKEPISASRFTAGLFTKVLMVIMPIVIALIVKIKGDALIWFIEWTILVLATSEGISIINNVLKAKGEPTLPKLDALAMIADKMRIVLETIFKKGKGE